MTWLLINTNHQTGSLLGHVADRYRTMEAAAKGYVDRTGKRIGRDCTGWTVWRRRERGPLPRIGAEVGFYGRLRHMDSAEIGEWFALLKTLGVRVSRDEYTDDERERR